jgi:hypothetical protein
MPDTARPTLAPLDELARSIQGVLRSDPPEPGLPSSTAQYAAHGYAAAEAYFHLATLRGDHVMPMRLELDGVPHWWLLDDRGRVIDLTLGRSDRPRAGAPGPYPYEEAVRRGFRWTALGPSARARHIIERIDGTATRALLERRRSARVGA